VREGKDMQKKSVLDSGGLTPEAFGMEVHTLPLADFMSCTSSVTLSTVEPLFYTCEGTE
jgi:hypothetical protein